jgi:hypothetical protein
MIPHGRSIWVQLTISAATTLTYLTSITFRSMNVSIRMGNRSVVYAIGKGKVRILLTESPFQQIFELVIEALYVSKLRMSLLSVGQLAARYDISFTGHTCFISHQCDTKVVLGELQAGFWALTGGGRSVQLCTLGQSSESSFAIPAAAVSSPSKPA